MTLSRFLSTEPEFHSAVCFRARYAGDVAACAGRRWLSPQTRQRCSCSHTVAAGRMRAPAGGGYEPDPGVAMELIRRSRENDAMTKTVGKWRVSVSGSSAGLQPSC